jgi:flagellar basal body-associated protein FliL
MKNIGLILGLVNTVAIAAVLGLFVYTKILFKHKPITEASERSKLEAKAAKVEPVNHVTVQIEPISSNLDPYTDANGKQKSHYITMTIGVELRSERDKAKFEELKPIIMDKILDHLGKKKFEDLNQVQGRYVFRSQIIDSANEFLKEPIVTEVYFSDFLLQ